MNKTYTLDIDTQFSASGNLIIALNGSDAAEVAETLTQLYPITGGAMGWTFAREIEGGIGFDITGETTIRWLLNNWVDRVGETLFVSV